MNRLQKLYWTNSQAEDSLILQNKQLAALHSLSARFNYGN